MIHVSTRDFRALALVRTGYGDDDSSGGLAVVGWDADNRVTVLMYHDQAPEMGEPAETLEDALRIEQGLWGDQVIQWVVEPLETTET